MGGGPQRDACEGDLRDACIDCVDSKLRAAYVLAVTGATTGCVLGARIGGGIGRAVDNVLR